MTRNDLLQILRREIRNITGYNAEPPLEYQHLLSQAVNSMGFLRLLLATEEVLDIVIDDEDFYNAAPLTIGDLVDFLCQQYLAEHETDNVVAVAVSA